MATYKDLRPREIEWAGDDPKEMMTSYTNVIGNTYIGFRIMYAGGGKLKLKDFHGGSTYDADSIDEAKQTAQSLFEAYCEEITKNIFTIMGSITTPN